MRPSEALAAHRAELRQLVSRHNLTHPRVFGSVLTGTDTDDSDLDLLVEPAETTTLLTIAGGILAWAGFAFYLHRILIGVAPLG